MAYEKFTITAPLGDGDKALCLRSVTGDSFDCLRELEERFDMGIFALFRHIAAGNYRIDHIREVIRLALIGGGMTSGEALRLVRLHVDTEPVAEHAPLAVDILSATLLGKEAAK